MVSELIGNEREGWSDYMSGRPNKGKLYFGKGEDHYWAGEAGLVR